MQNEKDVDFATEQGLINLDVTMGEQDLSDFIIMDLFCLRIIEKINPFRLLISGRDMCVSTSKTFIKDVKNDLPAFLKTLGIIQVRKRKFYVHKTKSIAYSLNTQKPIHFFSFSHRENKVEKKEMDEMNREEQSPKESKSRKNYFSPIKDFIGCAFGIFLFLKDNFCDLFKDEREW